MIAKSWLRGALALLILALPLLSGCGGGEGGNMGGAGTGNAGGTGTGAGGATGTGTGTGTSGGTTK